MSGSPGYRLLLAAMLPVIGLVVTFGGLKTDTLPIQVSSAGASTTLGEGFLPPTIGQWSRSGGVRLFTAENLYEYVNGHAEYFLSAGFEGLVVGEYSPPGADPSEPGVIVDIFDMGRGIQAFGVFADEVGNASPDVPFGEMGAKTPQGLNFVRGRYYVRIAAFDEKIALENVAARIDELMGTSRAASAVFSRFPDVGEVEATRFVRESYRGLDFADNVVERTYRLDGMTVRLSLARGDGEAMKDLIESYLTFFRESGVEYAVIEREELRLYRVKDPYEGDWYLVPMTDAVFGVYGKIDKGTLDLILRAMGEAKDR